MISELKKISIRGRVAFAAVILENAFKLEGLFEKKEVILLMDKIWDFTSSNALDEWDELIREITPYCLFDPKEEFKGFSHFDLSIVFKMKEFYASMPQYLVDLIDCAISIGTDNLYGGTGDFSPSTLEPLVEFLELSQKHHVKIPPIEIFTRYSFSEERGWGIKIDRQELM
jgi:hypothetical protein